MWFVASPKRQPEWNLPGWELPILYDTDADSQTIRVWCMYKGLTFICAFKQLESYNRNNQHEGWKFITSEQMQADIKQNTLQHGLTNGIVENEVYNG